MPDYAELKAINQHLRLAIDLVGEGVIILAAPPWSDSGPRIVFANEGFLTLSGRSREEVEGQGLAAILEADALPRFLAKLSTSQRDGQQTQAVFEVISGGGDSVRLEWNVTPVHNPRGEVVNFTVTVRPSRRELADPMDRLRASKMDSLALVSSGVAHDFNNILTTISANLTLASMEGQSAVDIREALSQASFAVEGAQQLTHQLLNFARGGTSRRKVCAFDQLLEEAIRLSTYGSNIRCETTLPRDLWAVEVDSTQVIQVFSNLVINARQAMQSGGVVQIEASNLQVPENEEATVEAGDYLAVEVRDRGCGISEEDQRKIFSPFFTTKKGGSGLGLATASTIIQRHGGTIEVNSKPNAGTTFRVLLPARPHKRPAVQPTLVHRGEVPKGRGRVLVVDDDPNIRQVSGSLLAKLGYQAELFECGEDAVQEYAQSVRDRREISAVLMDMTLPGGMSGDEAAAEIRRLDSRAKLIAFSGYFSGSGVDEVLRRGYAAAIPKPFSLEKLAQVLHEVIHRAELSATPPRRLAPLVAASAGPQRVDAEAERFTA
ncbi:MAG: ATP-binding protein [Verrucomicrobiota bacterium]